MPKVSILLPTLALSIILGSCSLLPGGEEGSPDQPQVIPPAAPQPATPETSELLTPNANTSVFIPSTDPDVRRKQTAQGRNDPFADLPLGTPQVVFVPEPPPEPVATQATPNVPSLNGGGGTAGGTAGTAGGGTAGGTAGTTGTSSGTALVALVPAPAKLSFSPILPELPQADLAEETQVTGVVQLNGVNHVMVQAPNEKHSRYVRVGDYIADGQVQVKRVDFRRNAPVVVLEQYGIEVYKQLDDALFANRREQSEPTEATPTLEQS